MKKLAIAVIIAGVFASCNTTKKNPNNDNTTQISKSKTTIISKKESAKTLLESINKYDAAMGSTVLHPDYEQHNPFIQDKAEGLLSLYPAVEKAGLTVEPVLILEDGKYVVAFNKWHNATLFGHGCNEMVSFDFYTVNEDAKLTGHWDAMQCESAPNKSGRTLTGGISEITDLDKTEKNKTKVVEMFKILIQGTPEEAMAAVKANFLPDYKQHNPDGSDGIEGFLETQMSGEVIPRWQFEKQHKVIGEGNYVLSISEGKHSGVHSIFYDLVRFENGKIAEHWDVIQAIPTEGLANENTMFNFN